MKKVLLFLILSALVLSAEAQDQTFSLSAEIRPRFEYRHGYKFLILETQDAAAFVSQRTRLNFQFQKPGLELHISAQNVHVWGEVPTLAQADVNGVMLYEAWGKVDLSPSLAIKVGRQAIALDNERIFGKVNWAQQGRSHDAVQAILSPDDRQTVRIGYSLSAVGQTLVKPQQSASSEYKNMFFAHYNAELKGADLSFLYLDFGIVADAAMGDLERNKTVGVRGLLGNKFQADVAYYRQFGSLAEQKVAADYAALFLKYRPVPDFAMSLGAEYLSGTNKNKAEEDKMGVFVPWFGTNHKFNGAMDYFYANGLIFPDGLLDYSVKLAYTGSKVSVGLSPHFFRSAVSEANRVADMDPKLGTEIDFDLGIKVGEDVRIRLGYSQLLSREGIEERLGIGGGDVRDFQNWAWVMLTFNPTLIQTTVPK